MSDRILAATRKGLFTIARAGNEWRVTSAAFVGDHVSMALADGRSGAWYAALFHGHFGCKLHRSRDSGITWEECVVPAYPPLPEGAEPDRCPMRGIPIPWSTHMIWSLEAGGAERPGRLWCGTLPGGLFRSEDGGDSWTLMRALWDNPARKQWIGGGYDYPGIHSICVDPRDSQTVAVGISAGGVWQTRDDGATWTYAGKGLRSDYTPPGEEYTTQTQDGHRMAQCAAHPDRLWIQHHNGIFRSDDGAVSWSEITGVEPSVFGFAVAAHPRDPATAWFAPAKKDEWRVPVDGKVVVTRTRDGGKSFETLRRGLPQEHAYDLVYRHGLDVDASGERLAMGSTTGSLWVSENQGDRWTCVSTHLPPIMAVRFAP